MVIVNDIISKCKVMAVFVMTVMPRRRPWSSTQVGHESWFRHYPPQILASPATFGSEFWLLQPAVRPPLQQERYSITIRQKGTRKKKILLRMRYALHVSGV